ncbi:OmpA family protein [Fulvivirga ulvae]|uniref:choice-of-anchor L domain-containing protein n=1 Tax=Fulvivirga ulvae TaxID=2904245 RepID=UPI001F34E0EA|nr:choice-of-anchor L domain-containing protein [Fulvivirga ulvae]UII34055.1 OmpA family protein [Fulvivirga ulvae]
MARYVFTVLIATLHMNISLFGQVVDTTRTANDLVNNILLGNGVQIGNVSFTGQKHAIGFYEDQTLQVGIEKGILLTSGNALFVAGPNKSPRSGWASDAAGDYELDAIARGKTYDAAVLEFDFVTVSENLSFQFVFASEEYLEYVGSKFNDVFAFFIEGPDIGKKNIARLPDGSTPITVNTVNNELNSQYYIDNTYVNTTDPFIWDVRNRKVIENKNYLQEEIPPKYNIQFDGFTQVLEARCKVVPNKVYHIKIAIADVGDGILDSGVILKGGSFRSYGDQVVSLDKHFRNEVTPKTAESKRPALAASGRQLTRSIPKEIILGNIEFEFDKYRIPVNAKNTLTTVINEWYKKPAGKIHVIGHTDSWGSDQYNIVLSRRRSEAVAHALSGLGIPESQLVIHFYGEERPLKTNDTTDGRARNRRVELVLSY